MAGIASGRMHKGWTALALGLALPGCASLPISGPTGHQVENAAEDGKKPAELPFRVISVDRMAAVPVVAGSVPLFSNDRLPPPTDLIGSGDVLDIEIYEAGVALFAGARASTTGIPSSTGAAQAEHLPPTRVDDKGEIFLPFVGKLRAGGHTTGELSAMIRRSLKGLSQDPQVMVNIAQSITNSVIVGGEVAKPGRLVLNTNRESLADVIALAGGWRGEAKDIAVQITRGPARIEYRLAEVMAGADHEFRIQPTDRIELLKKPQTFAVLGAAGRVEQLSFSAPAMSLAEALAASAGPNPNLGDAKAVFVFRFERGADGKEEPTVYHVNMMNAANIFLAQRFAMRDKDVLYVGNAAANQPSKLIQLVSQLFSPIVAVETTLVSTGAIK